MSERAAGSRRAVSPVVGVALLIGLTLMLTMVSGYVFLGLADTNDPSPDVVLDLEPTGDGVHYELVHEGGEPLGGEAVELRGARDPEALADRKLQTGDRQEVVPDGDTITVIWYDGDTSYPIAEFEATALAALGCPHVQSQVSGDTLILESGKSIACDVVYDISMPEADLTIQNGTTIVGDVGGNIDEFEIEDAAVTGTIDLSEIGASNSGYESLENVSVGGDVIADNTTKDQELDVAEDSTVDGSVSATGNEAEVSTSQNDDWVEIGGSVSATATGTGPAEVDLDDNTSVGGGITVDGGSAALTTGEDNVVGGGVTMTATDTSADFDIDDDTTINGDVVIDADTSVTLSADAGAQIDGDLTVTGDTIDESSIDPSQVSGTYDTTET